MTVTQLYVALSGTLFVAFSVMLSGNHWVSQILKIISIIMSMFAFAVVLGSLGLVLPGSMRWM